MTLRVLHLTSFLSTWIHEKVTKKHYFIISVQGLVFGNIRLVILFLILDFLVCIYVSIMMIY